MTAHQPCVCCIYSIHVDCLLLCQHCYCYKSFFPGTNCWNHKKIIKIIKSTKGQKLFIPVRGWMDDLLSLVADFLRLLIILNSVSMDLAYLQSVHTIQGLKDVYN